MDDTVDKDSQIVRAGSTTFFLDAKQTKAGKPYLTITESRFQGEGKKHRRSFISIFSEHISIFFKPSIQLQGELSKRNNSRVFSLCGINGLVNSGISPGSVFESPETRRMSPHWLLRPPPSPRHNTPTASQC